MPLPSPVMILSLHDGDGNNNNDDDNENSLFNNNDSNDEDNYYSDGDDDKSYDDDDDYDDDVDVISNVLVSVAISFESAPSNIWHRRLSSFLAKLE